MFTTTAPVCTASSVSHWSRLAMPSAMAFPAANTHGVVQAAAAYERRLETVLECSCEAMNAAGVCLQGAMAPSTAISTSGKYENCSTETAATLGMCESASSCCAVRTCANCGHIHLPVYVPLTASTKGPNHVQQHRPVQDQS